MPAFRSVVFVLLRALGDVSLHPQGRPCGPAATRRPPGSRPHPAARPRPSGRRPAFLASTALTWARYAANSTPASRWNSRARSARARAPAASSRWPNRSCKDASRSWSWLLARWTANSCCLAWMHRSTMPAAVRAVCRARRAAARSRRSAARSPPSPAPGRPRPALRPPGRGRWPAHHGDGQSGRARRPDRRRRPRPGRAHRPPGRGARPVVPSPRTRRQRPWLHPDGSTLAGGATRCCTTRANQKASPEATSGPHASRTSGTTTVTSGVEQHPSSAVLPDQHHSLSDHPGSLSHGGSQGFKSPHHPGSFPRGRHAV
jgi:hypothetical protein